MTEGGSSIPEVRALLAALVAAKPGGRIAELGTAFGEGAKAIADALGPAATFDAVEPGPERFQIARQALAGTRAEVLNGNWEDILPDRGPFDLIFFDSGTRAETLNLAIELLAPGGVLVKDDLTPGAPIEGDPVREAFLKDPRLVSAELLARADQGGDPRHAACGNSLTATRQFVVADGQLCRSYVISVGTSDGER